MIWADVIEGETPATFNADDGNDLEGGSKKQLTGKVVGIVKRNWRPYCGIILPSSTPNVRAL